MMAPIAIVLFILLYVLALLGLHRVIQNMKKWKDHD